MLDNSVERKLDCAGECAPLHAKIACDFSNAKIAGGTLAGGTLAGDFGNGVQSVVKIIEDPNEVHVWRSCCLDMDSRALLFFSQLLISLLVLGFCVHGVVVLDESNSQWQRMTISLLCGIWLPAPRVQK